MKPIIDKMVDNNGINFKKHVDAHRVCVVLLQYINLLNMCKSNNAMDNFDKELNYFSTIYKKLNDIEQGEYHHFLDMAIRYKATNTNLFTSV